MTALVVGCLVVIVIILVVWVRFRAGRSDRRSMESYGHALGVLGDVAKRTGPSPSVRVLPRGEAGRLHVRTTVSEPAAGSPPAQPPGPGRPGAEAPARGAGRHVTEPRARSGSAGVAMPPRSPGRPSVSIPVPEKHMSFEDRGEEWAGASRPALRDAVARAASRERLIGELPDADRGDPNGRSADPRERSRSDAGEAVQQQSDRQKAARERASTGGADRAGASPPTTTPVVPPAPDAPNARPEVGAEPAALQPLSPDELRRQATIRRLATGGFAAVAVIAIVAASIALAGHPKTGTTGSKKDKNTATTTSAPPTSVATTTTLKPAVVKPSSVSGNEASYTAPSGHYVLSFATSGGPCFVGVETALGSGDYLFANTLQPGTDATYKATGSLVVNLGAPVYVSVTVNGVALSIPSGVDYLAFAGH